LVSYYIVRKIIHTAMNTVRFAIVFCTFSAGHTFAEDSPQSQAYVIDNWQTAEGLPDKGVTSILQDQSGYLWIGTRNGLTRFDGVGFTTFRPIDTPERQDDQITSLYEDRHGELWVGTVRGLARYEDGYFISFNEQEGLSSERILCVGEDASGHIWAGTDAGLNRLEQSRFASFFSLEGLPDDRINAITMTRDNLVFATGKGLTEFGGVRFGPYKPAAGIPLDNVRLLQTDSKGNLWFADDAGLSQITVNPTGQDVLNAYRGKVTAFLISVSGDVWLGTGEGNLERLNAGSPAVVAHFSSAITALCEDREHNLWVGTESDGLYRIKKRELSVNQMISPGEQEVSSLLIQSSEEIWLCCASGIMWHWKTGRMVTNDPALEGLQARVLSGDGHSGVWVGTSDDGLFNYQNGRIQHWDELGGLSDNDIESLCVADGAVWLGTRNGGLNNLQAGRIKRFLTPWGLNGNYAAVITGDHRGRLWIGTTGDGLFCLSNGIFSAFTEKPGLPNKNVHALLADSDDVLWIGTDAGLVRLKGRQVNIFTTQDGLPDDRICQLQQDDFGNLWVGCNHGIYCLQKSQLDDYAAGRGQFFDAVSYDEADGLPALQCVPGAQITKAKHDDGHNDQIWFTTTRGVIGIKPSLIQWNLLPPPVVLEQVLMDNVPIALANPIRIRPGTARIQFQYSALSLTAPEKVRFRCQLEGFDHNWVNMGDKRMVQYTQVPPGRYRFRVIACNNDGIWSQLGDSAAVVVAPFWWQTTWFKLLALGIITVFAFGLLRQRRIRLRELEKLRMRIASDLHGEVGSSLWSITLLSQMLGKHGQLGQEEQRDAGEIHRIAKQTSNAIRDIVWIINPAFDTMQDLVQRMKDFAGTVLRGSEYQVRCEKLNLSHRLTLGFRENVFLMYKEILTNVAKHAQASAVEISLEELPGAWKLCVRDNGVGFDDSIPTSGNGLQNLRKRVEKIRATIDLASKPGGGTTVAITIPKFAEGPFWKRKLKQMFYEKNHTGARDHRLAR
jgi:ligand-binding sensor domain-containing protein/signal transduction histidine kinase